MRNIASILALIMIGGCDTPPEGSHASLETTGSVAELLPLAGERIVLYNVENLFDTIDDPRANDDDFLPHGRLRWTAERYALKLDRLAQALVWSGNGTAAVIGLTEVENRAVVEDLAATGALQAAAYTVVHHDSPDERGIDVALLVHPAYARVRKHQALPVRLQGGDRTRDVLHAELMVAGGEMLHVFVNHWPSRREGQELTEPRRMAAAAVVRHQVDGILHGDPDARILIMGDLNDGPTDRSVQEGLAAVCDASVQANLYALMCMDQPAGHGSYNYQGEWSYLDQFIVSRALLGAVDHAKAHWDDRLLFRHPRYGRSPDRTYAGDDHKGGYSDHLPVVLKLR